MKMTKIATLISMAVLFSGQTFAASAEQLANADVLTAVKARLAADPVTTNLHDVNLTSNRNGVVTITGRVDTDAEASRLVEVTDGTPGVSDVEANLKVRTSNQPMADSYITAKVKGALAREKVFGDRDVDVTGVTVTTTNGIVYLDGKVDTADQASNAVNLARSIKGVKKVVSKLVPGPSGMAPGSAG